MPEDGEDGRKRASFPAELTEGTRFGYKWFDSEGKQPLFPFGFGLSYTSYRYSNLRVDGAGKTATFTQENRGRRARTEIAQVYVQLPPASGEKFRRLAGWERVTLNAGESKTVTVELEPLASAVFNEGKDDWQWLPGEYTVSGGGSARSLGLTAKASLGR